jgi:REP element-mobilizing transposase RayT
MARLSSIMHALAYFITWTTYGTWLPGDKRGWVRAGILGIQNSDPVLEEKARYQMVEDSIVLTIAQRDIVKQTIVSHCRIREWTLHACNARTNHVHLVVSADHGIDDVMNQLKAWCSRKLSDSAGLTKVVAKKAGRRRWFTEGGDKEEIHDEEHLRNAIRYVNERQ